MLSYENNAPILCFNNNNTFKNFLFEVMKCSSYKHPITNSFSFLHLKMSSLLTSPHAQRTAKISSQFSTCSSCRHQTNKATLITPRLKFPPSRGDPAFDMHKQTSSFLPQLRFNLIQPIQAPERA